jgi:hypothetical protein
MITKLSNLLDKLSTFLAHRKGLFPVIGLFLIIVNFFCLIVFPDIWLSKTNFFLHFGILIGFLGFLLSRAL